MTVVEGWFGDNEISDEQFDKDSMALDDDLKNIIAEQCSINRTAYLIFTDAKAEEQTENANETDAATKSVAAPVATVIGNKTEGALINMIRAWGYDYDEMKAKNFNQKTDRIFSFNSDKKRSSAVIVRADGTVRVYCKGAAETLLEDCLHYRNKNGQKVVINKETKLKLERKINGMAERALRTLLLCHKDYPSLKSLPRDWKDCCPDSDGLCCDCIVGIIGTQFINSSNPM
jgi:magnesium-transporting ATPase (P-type)